MVTYSIQKPKQYCSSSSAKSARDSIFFIRKRIPQRNGVKSERTDTYEPDKWSCIALTTRTTQSMAFELFLSKKLNKAEENDWLLHNEKGEHESFSNGYLVEKSPEGYVSGQI